jgi:hypothetical protein
MLHDGLCFVGLDSFRHHVHDIFHHCCSELQVEMRLGSLFGHHFHHALRVAALEGSCQQVSKPSFEERNDASDEE